MVSRKYNVLIRPNIREISLVLYEYICARNLCKSVVNFDCRTTLKMLELYVHVKGCTVDIACGYLCIDLER